MEQGSFVVEVVRGDTVESIHRVDAVVCGVDGLVHTWGDATRPTIARSAIKAVQALPLVATGAADAYDLSQPELALACASHSAEPAHVEAVAAWLDRIGLTEDDLACGPDLPIDIPARHAVLRAGGGPEQRYNCCSGKHAGFLTVLRHQDLSPTGYLDPTSPIQQQVTRAVAAATDFDLDGQRPGIDGCGIPVFAIPLANLALAMARLTAPVHLPDDLAEAAPRVVAAAQQAFWVAGTDRTEQVVADHATEPILVKGGAEGVFMGALPQRGVGLALKAADGNGRATRMALRALLAGLDATADPGAGQEAIRNKAGNRSGWLRVTTGRPDEGRLAA